MAHVDNRQELDIRGESPSATEKRKAKKRELDRKAQQKKRKNDREMISKLKAQVKAFEQKSDDSQVYRLILKQERDREKLKRHLERVKQIESLIHADSRDLDEDDVLIPAGLPTNNKVLEVEHRDDTLDAFPTTSHIDRPSLSSDTTCVPNQRFVEYPRCHLDAMRWDEPTDGVQSSPDRDLNSLSPEECVDLEDSTILDEIFAISDSVDLSKLPALSPPPRDSSEPSWVLQGSFPFAVTQRSQGQDIHRCESMWSVCDSAIVQGQGLILYSADNLGFERDAHIIIMAITEGWEKAAKSHYWNGHWDSLRQIDQFCHPMCGPVERMASLYILSQLFKVRHRSQNCCTTADMNLKYQRFPGDPLSIQLPAHLRAR